MNWTCDKHCLLLLII